MRVKDIILSDKEIQLLGQQYEDEQTTCTLNHYLLLVQAKRAFSAGYEKRNHELITQQVIRR